MGLGLPRGTDNSTYSDMDLPLKVEIAMNPRQLTQSLEPDTIPGSPYLVVVAPPKGGAFMDDRGVLFAVSGTALTKLAPSQTTGVYPTPTTGQYWVDVLTGTYTFAAADTGLGVKISYVYTDGSVDVSWCIAGGSAAFGSAAGGSVHMLPTDKLSKLLYMIRGAWLEAFKTLNIAQIMPPAASLTPSQLTGLPRAGASFYYTFDVDALAALPDNPANAGL